MPDAPHEYVCPISLEVMKNPICVVHGTTVGRFDKRSLELHEQTEHRDRNPVTNAKGFLNTLRIADHILKAEIESSGWAEFVEEEERDDLVQDLAQTDNSVSLFESAILLGTGKSPYEYRIYEFYDTALPMPPVSGTLLFEALQNIYH